MIGREEETKLTWNILNQDGEVDVHIQLALGEFYIDTITRSPELNQVKEFHQALGEAIAIAEAQE